MLLYVFIALVILLLNEYRLIKKYITAIMNPEGNLEKSTMQKIAIVCFKPFSIIKYWIENELLNDELTYNS
jgi:hypothetical protein